MEDRLRSIIVPVDEEGFCKSFTTDQMDYVDTDNDDNIELNPFAFFRRFGFLVVSNVLTTDDCDKTISEIFDIIESKTPFKRNDTSTWDNFPNDGSSIPQYGSPSKPPIFSKQFLLNRTNPNVFKVFSKLLKNEDLLTNHDRCCFFRPTLMNKSFSTRDNVHLDMNPFNWMGDGEKQRQELDALTYARVGEFIVENNQPSKADGLQLQAVLNLENNHVEDGGYVAVPGFHHEFVEYFRAKKPEYESPSLNFDKKEMVFKLAKRIAMRKGSMVIWNQQIPHGSFGNKSYKPRFAQFIKMFPTFTVSKKRAQHRSKTLNAILNDNFNGEFPFTKLSVQLLGLNDYNIKTID
ncbi:hypothetical protein CYY_007389 [Polysphondylium violaceum]|uniref:Phytanoyl-CoA dioxygenase n=1 Tax=Polysphondylium violaceum TaxID=133409 RepID=A0A8J4V288_9MYCE|nr:hypothetical protein CYY_007389 [Polysphondylium violaceum]